MRPHPSAPQRWRRALQALFVAVALALLAAPMVVQVVRPYEPRRGENRVPAALPPAPASLAALPAWTAGIDAWLKDHFGLRKTYLDALDQIQYRVFGTFASPQILPGREGRIFLASHVGGEANRNSLILSVCGVRPTAASHQDMVRSLAEVLARSDAASQGRTLAVLVPDASVLYPQHLPAWLERRCRAAQPLLEGIMAALPEALRPRVVNLRPLLSALDPATPAVPRRNFHWDGDGPLRSAQWIAEEVLGRRPAFEMPTRMERKRSDITGFFPGLLLDGDVVEPDLARAGVAACYGAPCFEAALGPEAARVLSDLRRFDSKAPQGRLLLLTDSFGSFIAGGFTPYFREVMQVSTNNLPQLTAEQRARFRRAAIEEYRPDVTLLLFSDWGASYIWDILLRDLLPPGDPR